MLRFTSRAIERAIRGRPTLTATDAAANLSLVRFASAIGCQYHHGHGGEDPRSYSVAVGLFGMLGLAYASRREGFADGIVGHDTAQADDDNVTESKSFHLLDLETRKRTFFKYEKRIRTLSTPEKIFEYFSSIEVEGTKSMSQLDLLSALVAVYPPEGSTIERAGALLGERIPTRQTEVGDLMAFIDMDGDNNISYAEYMLVMTLMSIPLQDAELIFDIVDVDDNGVVDYDEFMTIIDQIQSQTPQAKKNRGGMRTGLNVGDLTKPVGILARFFGDNGKKKLSLAEFKSFLRDLHEKMIMLEFAHYDYQSNGEVSEMDPTLGNHQFTLKDFQDFHSLISRLQALSTALRFFSSTQGYVGRKEFKTVVRKVAGCDLSDVLVNIVFYMFGESEGKLNCNAFVDTFSRRRTAQFLERSGGPMKKSLIQCLHNCLA
ncbi:hypothetical protein BSKO_01717 [Bryopsis sp. KO-2023]|nr:hypothetical protein BSKO_01717 [Bryopsis sp. KO-2023]